MSSCFQCHQPVPEAARFCPHCGAPTLTSSERREERKTVTVLFADMVDFTARAERLDVEDVRGLLEPYHALVREQLENAGGAVEKFIGDAVMAVFGAPTAHEDDPERAVRAAIAIRTAVATANERDPTLDLHVRMAVNTGEALVWLDARPAAGEGVASGDVVNTAARLQTAAPVDGVLVGELTYRATRDVIEYVEEEPISAKGKADPVACWRVLGARSRVGERRARQETPLVDRVRERAALLNAFERSRDGRSVEVCTLIGVPGIGKSRLVWELSEHIASMPDIIRWRHGRSPAYGHGAAFPALAEIVKAEAGLLESHDAETAVVLLRRAIAAVVDDPNESAWLEQHLRALVGIEPDVVLFGDRRAEAFAAWRRFLELIAGHRPTVLVFDDLHWADDLMLDFIEHLAAWAGDVPLFVLCTARPDLLERRPGWGAEAEHGRVIRLGPLSEAETGEFLDDLLGQSQLPPETRAVLLANAEGNPLYAQEFLRMLIDAGILVESDGTWVLTATRDLPVPDSVVGIIAARLDVLPPDDKAVAQDAAVIGRVIWPGAVAHVAGRGAWAIEEALHRLQQRQLVRRRAESTVVGETEYIFEHALIREVAYRSIVRSQRADKHERAAEWLTSLPGDRRDRADTIAHHYVSALENAQASGREASHLRVAASHALEEAAERARALHSHRVAARLYGEALELDAGESGRRPRLLLARGRALALADEPAQDALAAAVDELLAANDHSGAAEAESTAGWLLSLAGKPELARQRDARALELAAGAEPSEAMALIFARAGAHTMFVRDRRESALELLRNGLAIATRLGLREMEAEALQFVGMARLDAGEAAGLEDMERALAISTELNSAVSLSCYGNLAEMLRNGGRLAEAAALREDGHRAAERFGVPVQVRRFRAEQAGDLYHRGAWDDALARIGDYLYVIGAGSPHRGESEARILRGRMLLARGDVDAAWTDAEAGLRFARHTEESFNLFPALAFHAHASLLRTREHVEADIAELARGLPGSQPFWWAWALPDLVAVFDPAGRLGELHAMIAGATPESRWYAAAAAACEGDHARSADLYAEIGSRPAEAVARLRAAEAALGEGAAERAQLQIKLAIDFFREVRAATYLRTAESMTSVKPAP